MRDGKICGDKYIGETSLSLAERVGKHINDCKGRKDKRINELKVVSMAPGDPLLHQLTEAILIEEKKPHMNAKDE